jgi:hypothetical protein
MEVLDAIHEHVEKGHSLVRVQVDGPAIHDQADQHTFNPTEHVADSAASGRR